MRIVLKLITIVLIQVLLWGNTALAGSTFFAKATQRRKQADTLAANIIVHTQVLQSAYQHFYDQLIQKKLNLDNDYVEDIIESSLEFLNSGFDLLGVIKSHKAAKLAAAGDGSTP